MGKIRVTENELKQLIKESVESVLNEEILNEKKFLRVDLRNMPTPQNQTDSYNNLMSNPSDSPNAMNMIKAYNRNELYQKLENLGFSKEQIVQGLNAGAAGVYRTRANGTEKDLTNTNRGQRKINRARVYSGKHGGPEASEITANQVKTLSDKVNELTAKNTDLENQVATLNGQIETLKKERDAARAQGRKLSADYQNLQNQLNSANQARTQNAAAQQQNAQQKAPAQQTTQPQQNQAVLATQNAMKGVQIPPITSPLGVVNTTQTQKR